MELLGALESEKLTKQKCKQYCGTHVFKGTGMYNWYLKQKKNLIKAKLSNPIQKTFFLAQTMIYWQNSVKCQLFD